MILNETFKLKKKICLSFSSTSFFLTLVQRYKNKNVVYFSNDNKHLDRIKNEIKSIDPQIRVFTLTDFDCSFFSYLSPTKEILSSRINTIYELIFPNYSRNIFLININSVVNKLIPISEIDKKRLIINNNEKDIYEKIVKYLKENMYEKVEFVRDKGEYAVRGDIIDAYSPNENYPIRISFNINDIESLYTFNLETQKSIKKKEKYTFF